jgi:hypothetical protein
MRGRCVRATSTRCSIRDKVARSKVFQSGGSVHHRHAGKADIVLQHNGLAEQRSTRRTFHGAFHVPGVERVLSGRWLITKRARIGGARLLIRQFVHDALLGSHNAIHHAMEDRKPVRRDSPVESGDDRLQLSKRRFFNALEPAFFANVKMRRYD